MAGLLHVWKDVMAIRVVNGNTRTEDGWPLVDQAGCTWIAIPGTNPTVRIQAQTGIPCKLFAPWVADLNAFVEIVRDADTASWTEGNSVLGTPGKNNGSNHLGGTAVDVDWADHPMGPAYAGYSQAQIDTIREMTAFYTTPSGLRLIFWAEDWDTPKDSMHFQLGYDTFGRQDEINTWIAQNIRPDGFSTFRRAGAPTPPDTASVLSQAMGGEVSIGRYIQLLPAVMASLEFCQCTTTSRVAMWCAQLGEESGGLQWMEELASGNEYEGRTDLGNTQPGDGMAYKGRGPIQITGRSNYTRLSAWAFSQGIVPSPTFFVDQPTQLSSDQYGFIGVDWYWTVARNMNSYADNADILGATKAVNGGTNGLQDRTDRWNRCLAMADLLTLTTGEDDMAAVPQTEWAEALDLLRQGAKYRRPSLSAFRHVGEGDVNTCMGFAWSADGSTHVQLVERLAVEYGDPTSVALLMEVAAADPVKYPDRAWDAQLAARILTKVSDTAKADANKQIAAWLAAETK